MEKARPKHKRVFALLLAAIMLLSGCGISTPEPPAAELIGCVGDLPASLMLADAGGKLIVCAQYDGRTGLTAVDVDADTVTATRELPGWYELSAQRFDDDIADSPALMEKLRIMCEAIRAGFDTEGWTELPWERLLK